MTESELTTLSKQICAENGVELDHEACEKFREAVARAGANWQAGTYKVLQEKNPMLLERLKSLESQLDSLMLIPHKPAMLKKDFKVKLEEYEKTIGMCIDYASRHMETK